jgi:hypothetical protein
LPTFPGLPSLPDTKALRIAIGIPAPRNLAEDAQALLHDAQTRDDARTLPVAMTRRPRSAFGALLAEIAVPTAPNAAQLQLREAIFAAVGRVLPASLRLHAPALHALFNRLDETIYDIPPTTGPVSDHPQLELANSGLLQPIVSMLALRAPDGSYAPDLRAFRDLVTTALRAEPYRVADATPAGG